MKIRRWTIWSMLGLLCWGVASAAFSADGTNTEQVPFHGRIAYSCDGNHNDPGQEGRGWSSQTIPDVAIRRGDEIAVELQADGETAGKLDYVQLNRRELR